ncbi:Transmembrane protein, partial [Phytophthora megakarya]
MTYNFLKWCCALVFPLLTSAVDLTLEEVAEWNETFDWARAETDATVQIVGNGVQDTEGNLYFAGSKSLNVSNVDLLNIFVARINANGSIGWTHEWGTDKADAATSITIVNETNATTGATMEYLYVPGYTWGYLDEGGHALNGFGQYGGRDVVLAKISLDGDKLWMRQFGTTANDFAYGVSLDGSFNTLLLSGGCSTNQVDQTVEVEVAQVLETRTHAGMLFDYEPQIMDPKARSSAHHADYDFAVSLSFGGDILDYAMDGGVTLTPRRRRIREGSLVAEYAVVLNRQPLAGVVVVAQDLRLLDPSGKPVQQLRFLTSQSVVFTPANWNREQFVRLTAVDDALAEGRHYAVVTHSVTSTDPNFDGSDTPFLAGRNVTVQIDDNDLAGISLARQHVFVAEGGGNDSYDIVLTSQPWHPVKVVIVPLHANQTAVASQVSSTPSVAGTAELVFLPENWNIPQRVVVSAMDDVVSEVEYGGLYNGGSLLHYTESKDMRYHTRRPQCFDVPNCDPSNSSACLFSNAELNAGQTSVRFCDITNGCAFAQGNGACISNVVSNNGKIPARFGNPPIDPGRMDDAMVDLTYADLITIRTAQESDSNLTVLSNVLAAQNNSALEFTPPPPALRGYVLSFLGLMNVEQARKMSANPKNVLHTICAGLVRLETMRWAFEEWPSGYVNRVLEAIFEMFPQSYSLERHSWNCGMANFLPDSTIDVSIWDNDPGVTLSIASLDVTEGDTTGATYNVVLNAPPSIGGKAKFINSTDKMVSSAYCANKQSDACGFWGGNFSTLAAAIYDQSVWNTSNASPPNVSIAIIGNSQLAISPSLLTFTATDWFVPQSVLVQAVDDSVAELNESYTISHRLQNSPYGYINTTAFWFEGTIAPATIWNTVCGIAIPYNVVPTVLNSPDHSQINVFVRDNDVAKIDVVVNQPNHKLATKEAIDTMDWVGDYVTVLAFHDITMTTTTGQISQSVLQNILVFGANMKTFMKFHLPRLHDGDTSLTYSGAMLVLHQTPYKIFNVSDSSAGNDTSTGEVSFTKEYTLNVTAVDNAWTKASLLNGTRTPQPLTFLTNGASIQIPATVEKSRSIEVDISPLLKQLLPTRLSVVSLMIQVISEGETTASIATTQLCSSVFERKLRPLLSLFYQFPNILSGLVATQSSTAISAVTTNPLVASLATNGANYDASINSTVDVATTISEKEPWWEVELPQLTKVGTLVIFVPASFVKTSDTDPITFVVIASLKPFNSRALSLNDALMYGCPSACPKVESLPGRKRILLWEIQAGAVAVRIYREGTGVLQLSQVQAFDAFILVTPTSNGAGIRSRLKSDWGPGTELLQSWRLLQTVRRSEDENVAIGMATRQSTTSPSNALSCLAVDGLKHTNWDPLIIRDEGDTTMVAGSTRTDVETNSWWEVDLGTTKPVRSVVLYPYVGTHYDELCALQPATYPAWSGDLHDYSRYDPLLQLKAPFIQQFDVLLSDQPLTNSDGSASGASTTTRMTLSYSCVNYTHSISWDNVFSAARFVTVKKRGLGALMLNEVEVLRWNPATMSRYLLLDLFGAGEKPLAIASVQVFPPSDVTLADAASLTVAKPLTYKIHSVSSQLENTGAGSANALLKTKDNTLCYIANTSSYHEWVVLEFDVPVEIGLVDVNTNVSQCSPTNVASVTEFSIASHGSVLNGIRSDTASQALDTENLSTVCKLNATGIIVMPSSHCKSYVCTQEACQIPLRVRNAAGQSLILSDFVDIAVLGKSELLPVHRLPLSVNENRVLLLRDNPVVVWPFDDTPKVLVSNDKSGASWGGYSRATGAFQLKTTSASVDLNVDDTLEGTFFSATTTTQSVMSSFSLEFWFDFNEEFLYTAGNNPAACAVNMYGMDANGNQVTFGSVGISRATGLFYFTMTNPTDFTICRADLENDASILPFPETWHQVVATYDPMSSSISLSICVSGEQQIVNCYTSTTLCNMALLSLSQKIFRFGAPDSVVDGFEGSIARVSWFVRALTTTEILDHYHDFLDGMSTAATAAHNTYSIELSAKPLQPVTVKMDSENACYRSNLCNVSTIPTVLVFTAENWNLPQLVHVLATDDQLYEGLHYADIFHVASSPPSHQLTSTVSTLSVNSATAGENLLDDMDMSVTAFYRDFVFYKILEPNEQLARQDVLVGMQMNWTLQTVQDIVVPSNAYANPITVSPVLVTITDLTVPGIEFSTASLSVSEDGKANDYQVVLLSEPTEDVRVTLYIASDCYRACKTKSLCPSHSVKLSDGTFATAQNTSSWSCGDNTESMSTSTLLCNITLSPDVLIFTASDWSLPKTVRVLAVDDYLDEADIHIAIVHSTSASLDPVYNDIVLPDIVVAIADNDNTNMTYSTKLVSLSEKGLGASLLSYPREEYYTLQLLTEPYANVTIAMSNEANKLCYRVCGYPSDLGSCGLPRQQSVSMVQLRSNSTREIHQIALSMSKITEVQRIVTYANHVDQVILLAVSGGFGLEIQSIVFTFNDAFKRRFPSADAITSTASYGSTFTISNGAGSWTSALDVFSTALQLQTAINGLFPGRNSAVNVTRDVQYAVSTLTWNITFLTFVRSNGTFPLLSVAGNDAIQGGMTCQRTRASSTPTGTFTLRYGEATFPVPILPTAAALQSTLTSQTGIYTAAVLRRLLNNGGYGFEYVITFVRMDTFSSLVVNSTAGVKLSVDSTSQVSILVNETQSPVLIGGAFVIDYYTPLNITTFLWIRRLKCQF